MDKPGVWGQSPQQAQVRCRRSGVSLRTPVPEARTLACISYLAKCGVIKDATRSGKFLILIIKILSNLSPTQPMHVLYFKKKGP